MVSKRLSNLSKYQVAKDLSLIQNTHTSLLSNTAVLTRSPQHPEKRQIHFTWFNPPFSSNVETKISKKFFNILDKYFPKHHHLHKVINRNTVKLSYCRMPNVDRLLKAHNQKVLKQHQGDSTDQNSATCNCRNKANCHLPASLSDQVNCLPGKCTIGRRSLVFLHRPD